MVATHSPYGSTLHRLLMENMRRQPRRRAGILPPADVRRARMRVTVSASPDGVEQACSSNDNDASSPRGEAPSLRRRADWPTRVSLVPTVVSVSRM